MDSLFFQDLFDRLGLFDAPNIGNARPRGLTSAT